MTDIKCCSHGRSWDEDCPKCDAMWLMQVTLPDLIRNSKRAAHFALQYPGISERNAATALAALHAHVAVLAECVAKMQKERT